MEMTVTMFLCNIITLTALVLLVPPPHAETSKFSMTHLRMDLKHIDLHGNFSKIMLFKRMTQRSHQRMMRLLKKTHSAVSQFDSSLVSGAQTDVHTGIGEFVMDIAIGTPSLSFSAILDTGSDLVWTQCKPCQRCFNQSTPLFDPSTSSTYKQLPCTINLCTPLPYFKCGVNDSCEYQYSYADKTSTSGKLSSETFTMGSTKLENIVFGCATDNTDGLPASSGLVGLGRDRLSLISQLGFRKFSYCFASLDEQKKSLILFGSLAYLNKSAATGPIQSTPLVQSLQNPTFYYLSLLGITVSSTRLEIPTTSFALKKDGSGGTVIDSGTTITFLQEAAYNVVKSAFISKIKLPVVDGSIVGADLCFSMPSNASIDLPNFILHFDGADLDLPDANYFISDPDTGLLCLTVMPSPDTSIIGNMLQQNLFITYDVGENKLSFIPTQCDKL